MNKEEIKIITLGDIFCNLETEEQAVEFLKYIKNLQQENKNLLYYKKIIDKIIIVKDYPSKEDSNYILCNMSKQELYKLLCETRERIYKGR